MPPNLCTMARVTLQTPPNNSWCEQIHPGMDSHSLKLCEARRIIIYSHCNYSEAAVISTQTLCQLIMEATAVLVLVDHTGTMLQDCLFVHEYRACSLHAMHGTVSCDAHFCEVLTHECAPYALVPVNPIHLLHRVRRCVWHICTVLCDDE
jgi:hypothetical protein